LKWIRVPSKPTKDLSQLKHDKARQKYLSACGLQK
jgi:hypothetical protein